MLATPYCSTEEYETRYGHVANKTQLGECLIDATRLLESELRSRGVDPATVDGGLLMQACRQMANRVVPSGPEGEPGLPVGASNVSYTAGPYTYQVGYSAPYGTPRVSQSELDLLGLGGPVAGWAALTADE